MTVGRISFVCWTVFVLMCVAFLPLAVAIDRVPVLPEGARPALAVVVVGVLWWGPFAYAMYLAIAVTFQTTCSLSLSGFAVGRTVEVAVARRNPGRVTIVPGTAWPWRSRGTVLPAGAAGVTFDPYAGPVPPSPRERLVSELTGLGRLHADGVLTDAEFAARKARILDELGDDPPRGMPV